jgi:phosphatidate cytidylyltransferase
VLVLPEPPPPASAAGGRWSDLRKRLISAAILAPIVLLCIWLGGVPYAVLLLGASIGLAWEWVALCGATPLGWPGVLVVVAAVAGAFAAALGQAPAGLATLALGAAATAVAARGSVQWRALSTGIPYVGVGVIALLWLRGDGRTGLTNLLFLLLLVWASDIGAYLAGRILGGPKLAPRVSPGKTWSGALGGLAAAVLMALLVAWWSGEAAELWRVAGIAVGLGIVAQAGDLLESLIKRHFGVKDSGRLIPGHGGLLDRLDALLIAAPVAALLAFAAGRGVVLWQ